MLHQVVFRAKVSHGDSVCNIVSGGEYGGVEQERIDGGGRHRRGCSFSHTMRREGTVCELDDR